MTRLSQLRQPAEFYLLALGGLLVFTLAAWPIRQPGTMDSHYYYGGGQSLLQNRAFVEPYIWNYLDDPAGLPAPSHLYWMPLPSMLVAAAQAILGSSFRVAQIPFILLAVGLPLVSYGTSWALSRNRRHALMAGLLTIFSGFYLPYWTLPETFAPFAITGGLTLYALGRWAEDRRERCLLGAGLMAGLGHLCRADGVLLLVTGLFIVFLAEWRRPQRVIRAGLALLVGYLVVMAPWFARNWQVSGAALATAGAKTIFLRGYDELFSYGTPLTWERYLAWGTGNILRSKLAAGWTNLQTFIAVNNLIFLTPLSLAGLWRSRRRPFLWPAATWGIALYGVMTLLFTFPGARGGVFHSSAALLPALFAASQVGLDAAVGWVARRRRRWDPRGARRFFSLGLVLLAAGMSLFIYTQRVIGHGTWAAPSWNQADAAMVQIGDRIKTGATDQVVVMVGNPPAFYYHTGLPAIVIPNEGIDGVLQSARRYGASYLVLDQNRPEPLAPLYRQEEEHPALDLIWDKATGAPAGVMIYQIIDS